MEGAVGHYAIMVLADSINFSASRVVGKIFMVGTSLMTSFYPTKTAFFFLTDWTLVHTNEIEQQMDSVSCGGALCCLNAYRLPMRDVVGSVIDKCIIIKLRYWIATVARMANANACRKSVSKPLKYKEICVQEKVTG